MMTTDTTYALTHSDYGTFYFVVQENIHAIIVSHFAFRRADGTYPAHMHRSADSPNEWHTFLDNSSTSFTVGAARKLWAEFVAEGWQVQS